MSIRKFISRSLSYTDLIRSCDIGLSTVLLDANILKENLFPNISTKEDYICWLNIIKKNPISLAIKKLLLYIEKKSHHRIYYKVYQCI